MLSQVCASEYQGYCLDPGSLGSLDPHDGECAGSQYRTDPRKMLAF